MIILVNNCMGRSDQGAFSGWCIHVIHLCLVKHVTHVIIGFLANVILFFSEQSHVRFNRLKRFIYLKCKSPPTARTCNRQNFDRNKDI